MLDIKFCLKNSTAVPSVGASNTTNYAAIIGQLEIESNMVAFLPREVPATSAVVASAAVCMLVWAAAGGGTWCCCSVRGVRRKETSDIGSSQQFCVITVAFVLFCTFL